MGDTFVSELRGNSFRPLQHLEVVVKLTSSEAAKLET